MTEPTMVVVPGSPNGGGAAWTTGTGSGVEDRLSAKRTSSANRGSASSAHAWHSREDEGHTRFSTGATKIGAVAKSAAKRPSLRALLSHSDWYHSRACNRLRKIILGKHFAVVMSIALFLALFMPDIWILAGVNSNEVSDVVLTIVMVLFAIELICLSLVEVSYLVSFFQLMDIIGTVSMIFDISYMVGTDATFAPTASNDSDAQKNLLLLRASRAAKLGARAGRLSRVLRILRFLPFLTGGASKTRVGIASVISGQLANLLATRVACLTIILVMCIPVFDIWTFPQADHSLQTWVERISKNMELDKVNQSFRELDLMDVFYSGYDYWPHMACEGASLVRDGRGDFQCGDVFQWQADRGAPPRAASSLRVHTGTFMVAFNMHAQNQLKSALNMATICFIVFIMVFSGLALSSVVTELAVRPLERMLATVQQIASTVFKLGNTVGVSDVEEEETNIDNSSEMKLLEKVVQKLAIVADLASTKNYQDTEDLGDEDLGILSMMQGKNVVETQRAVQQARQSCAMPRKKALIPTIQTIRLEDFGVTQEVFESWAFNALPLSRSQRTSLAVFTVSRFHESGDGFVNTQERVQVLQRFVQAVEKEYMAVPYHNFAHAVDTTHCVARLMQTMNSEHFLTDLEQYSLLISAIAHDLGHPGVNNGFLSEVGHDLALQYNDRAPLENMHCAKLYTITANPNTNIFRQFTKDQYREARKHCIDTILHTDMTAHNSMVKDLQMTYQMNQEVFMNKSECPKEVMGGANMAEIEIFSQADTKSLVLGCILHSADVSNPCKSWETTHAWAMVCLEEFFAQGDQEKMLGIPVQFLNDRDKLNKPNSQIGFIEFMISPFFAAQLHLWPSLRELGENLANNLANWADLWEREVNPNEEDKQKVQARVQKVKDAMLEATTRGGHLSAVPGLAS